MNLCFNNGFAGKEVEAPDTSVDTEVLYGEPKTPYPIPHTPYPQPMPANPHILTLHPHAELVLNNAYKSSSLCQHKGSSLNLQPSYLSRTYLQPSAPWVSLCLASCCILSFCVSV